MARRPPLRIGILGAGGRGWIARHAAGAGGRIVAACDLSPAVLERCGKVYGEDTRLTADWRDFLSGGGMDAVMICTPDQFHEEHAVAALEAGYDVFCEKPLATSVAGCDRILATAARLGRKLFIGHNMRYMRFTRLMKRLVDEGAIGEVKAVWCRHFVSYGGDAYFRDWHAERSNSTGLLLQKGAHDLDIIQWLAGAPAVRVSAFGSLAVYGGRPRRSPDSPGSAAFDLRHWPADRVEGLNPVIDVEDLSMVNLELGNGVLATYEQCHFTPDAWRNYTVIGTKGRIENRGDYSGTARIELYTRRTDRFSRPDRVWRLHHLPFVAHGGADSRLVAEFIEHVRDGKPTWTSPVASRDAVATGCLATESLRSGGVPLEVPALDREIAAYFRADGP